MPILWHYLLKAYLKVLFLCIGSFVVVLLTTRLKEIARFAAISGDFCRVILFTLYQIPHILPVAIPISGLISSMLLFHKLSTNHELTALRASGLSLKTIITPIVFAAFFLSFLNLFICSELTSRSRIESKNMLYSQSSFNPIFLLSKQKLLKIKDAFIDFKIKKEGKSAEDLIFIINNKTNRRLNLISAKNLEVDQNELLGKNVSIISYLQSQWPNTFDHLIIENQHLMSTNANALSQFMKSSHWSLNMHHLPLKMLLIKSKIDKNKSHGDLPYLELIRRFSLAACALSFTFLGICFGIQIGRNYSKKKMFIAAILGFLVLISFAFGKSYKHHPIVASVIYLLPQPFVLVIALRTLKKISGGIE